MAKKKSAPKSEGGVNFLAELMAIVAVILTVLLGISD